MDLVFVVDASGSIRNSNPSDNSYDNWMLMLQFINNIVNQFLVGPDKLQVGLVTFGNSAHNEIFLNNYTNVDQIRAAVLRTTYLDQNTNTSGGIRVMWSQQFLQQNGDRNDAPNVAIIITDGASTYDSKQTIPEAVRAQGQNILMFSVGVTDKVNEVEIRAISSPPQKLGKNYFLSTDFQTLKDIEISISNQVCGTNIQPTVTPRPTQPPTQTPVPSSGKLHCHLLYKIVTELCNIGSV